ncbi:MAG TPA: carbohydrate ABC transporter permease [Aggregatilineales bacterium]|nr:carbohydrate ABC transporter permease [Anaerolineae bacterium]HUN06212.1 carbohydrate ABC transporter permease [Aggregatilineales bacterium]
MNRSARPLGQTLQLTLAHVALIAYTLIALFPVALVVMNSFKVRNAIFKTPYNLPDAESFSLVGYETVLSRAAFPSYFLNSLIVTVVSLLLIFIAGTMAAHALSEYQFPGNRLLGLYMALGIMVPIRLGTVSILRLVVDLSLVDTLIALILVYTAMGLPLAVFVLSEFMRQIPRDLKDAARVDGASEYRIYWMTVPLIRPAIGTVMVFNMIPIWNDLWFPLILAPSERNKTITLGAQQFLGQFVSDWNAVLSSLSLAALPVIVLYVLFSRQLIRGLTSGAVK